MKEAGLYKTYEAAPLLGMGRMKVEADMRAGTFPFGVAWHDGNDEFGKPRYTYKIPKKGLDEFLGLCGELSMTSDLRWIGDLLKSGVLTKEDILRGLKEKVSNEDLKGVGG